MAAQTDSTDQNMAVTDVEQAETRLYAAMMHDDYEALDALLAPDVTYVHSNGVAEDKETYLRGVRGGLYEYERIEIQQGHTRLFGTVAIMTGQIHMWVGNRGQSKPLVRLLSTLVWTREFGEGWRLLRRHATRLPDPDARTVPIAEEKDAIRETMARYCQALDACRFDKVAALFWDDGEWTTDYDSARGHAEIEAMLTRNVPRKGEGPQRKHFITNIVIDLNGDRAEALSDYLIIRESETGLIPVMGGTYKDRFRKRDGLWRFQRKELVHDIVGDMALKNGR